jgi:multidrug resistance efflux pump
VTRVRVRNDEQVEKDAVLLQIDPRPYEIELARARANLAGSRSQLAAAQSTIAVARAKLEAAIANEEKARKDATRQATLHKKDPGTISLRRVEIAESTWKQAIAKVAAARAELQKAREKEKGAQERLLGARAAVDKAELDLENTTIKAPVAGVITDLRIDTGHYAGTGHAVMTLVAIHQVWIEAQFTENNLGHLEKGTPVEFVLDVQPGKVFQGQVRSIGLGVNTGIQPPPGELPTIRNSRDWLRQAQRFPVIVQFDRRQEGLDPAMLRVGGQAEVIAYTSGAWLLRPLGMLFIRFMSLLSYAY